MTHNIFRHYLATFSLIFLLSFGINTQAQDSPHYSVSQVEEALVSKYPEIQFAYVPENVRALVVSLFKDAPCDSLVRELCCDLESGVHISRYQEMFDLMPLVIAELSARKDCLSSADYQNDMALSLEYQKALENGEALLMSDSSSRKSDRPKCYCKLFAKCLTAGHLIVNGNATIRGDLTVNGSILGPNGPISITGATGATGNTGATGALGGTWR